MKISIQLLNKEYEVLNEFSLISYRSFEKYSLFSIFKYKIIYVLCQLQFLQNDEMMSNYLLTNFLTYYNVMWTSNNKEKRDIIRLWFEPNGKYILAKNWQ